VRYAENIGSSTDTCLIGNWKRQEFVIALAIGLFMAFASMRVASGRRLSGRDSLGVMDEGSYLCVVVICVHTGSLAGMSLIGTWSFRQASLIARKRGSPLRQPSINALPVRWSDAVRGRTAPSSGANFNRTPERYLVASPFNFRVSASSRLIMIEGSVPPGRKRGRIGSGGLRFFGMDIARRS
jgi:hypothetical protein